MGFINEKERREILKKTKPLVYNKIIQYNDKFARGETISPIDFAYSYDCNFSCEHCSANSFEKKERIFTVADVKELADQADEMGLAQFIISGGEPLLFKELDQIIEAIDPQRFNISINTNGYLLTAEKARHLKELGVDKLRVSIDSIDEIVHEQNRGKKGSYSQAIAALHYAKEAGMDPLIQTVLTRQNAQSEETVKLAQYAKENEFTVDIQIAKPVGGWARNYDVLLEPDDIKYMDSLNNDYPFRRDMTPGYGNDPGCLSVKKLIHITKYGDVLPCPFIHIALGNIFKEPLKHIIERGFSVKYFRNRQEQCLSGENREFIEKFIAKTYDRPLPVPYNEIFTDPDDFVKGE